MSEERWADAVSEFVEYGTTSELTAVLFPEISQTVEEWEQERQEAQHEDV